MVSFADISTNPADYMRTLNAASVVPEPQAAPAPQAGNAFPVSQPQPPQSGGVFDIINTAAQRHGVDPLAMQSIAYLESRFDPSAQNPNSSAGGLFQQIDSNARAYGVTDRFDPSQSAEGAARFASENTRTLRNVLGRDPTVGELYLAHQQGPGGASRLLRNPNARAADIVGADAVRLNGGTLDMSAQEFANIWINKAERAAVRLSNGEYTAPEITGNAAQPIAYGQQGQDQIAPSIEPARVQAVYDAYASGAMSPEDRARYSQGVQSGAIPLPEGVDPASIMPAPEVVQIDPNVALNTYNAAVSGAMSPADTRRYWGGVQSGVIPLPEGLEIPARNYSPGPPDGRPADVLDAEDAAPKPPRRESLAANMGSDSFALAGQAAQSALGIGGEQQSVAGQMLPEGVPDWVRDLTGPTLDLVLAPAMAAQGLYETGAGAAGDIAVALGQTPTQGRQLARDLAAMPEAFAGSPQGMLARRPDTPDLPPRRPQAAPVATPRRVAPDAANVALTEAETDTMRTLIARAARGDTSARQELARQALVNPEAAQAAQRLEIDLPADVFADNAAVQQAAGIVRAVRGSDAGAEWQEAFEGAQRRASAIIEGQGGSRDLAATAERVRQDLTGSIDTLRTDAGAIFNEIRDQIPTGTRLSLDRTTQEISGIVTDLGGVESLPAPVRRLFNAVTSDQGVTYARLMQERDQIGRALAKNQGPYADADGRTLSRLYGALADDQRGFVSRQVGEEAATRLDEANRLWSSAKDIEDRLVAGFGRDHEGSIANRLRSAITNSSRGDVTNLNRVLDVVPEGLQREALLTGIASLSEATSGQGGFSFARYAQTYRGLRENSPIYNRMAGILGKETTDVMRDLYEVSVRVDRAAQNVPRTGMSNQALIADGLISGVLNSTGGRYARSAAAGTAGNMIGGPVLGGLAAASAQGGRWGRDASVAVGNLFRDPAFQQLAIEAGTTGATQQTINRVQRSGVFRRWAEVSGISDPSTWLIGAMAAPAAQEEQDGPR